MLSVIEYPPGTPCWTDLSSPDLDASAHFYGELFGWETRPIEEPGEETLGYRLFTLDSASVAGLGPARDRPPAWSTYVAVEYAVRYPDNVSRMVLLCPSGMGDQEQALTWMEKAYEERADGLTWIGVDPMLDDIRSHPRFQTLMKKMGLS